MRPDDWPANLYERRGYYSWRHPVTRKEYGLGRDYQEARQQAIEANESFRTPNLAQRVETQQRTLGDFLPTYRKGLDDLKPNTRSARKSEIKHIEEELSDIAIGVRFEDAPEMARRCHVFLDSFVKRGMNRTAKALRTRLVDIFAAMIAQGWLAVNPALHLKLPAVVVQRERLTLEDFRKIYAVAPTHMQRAMELAVVTAQRLGDVSRMRFRDVRDGFLWVEQEKTQARLKLPLKLRQNALGWSLDEVIARCRDNVLSQALIHHTAHQGLAKPGMPVHKQTISNDFRAARIRAGITGEHAPSFHEIRSLAIRLYKEQGEDAQAIAGHKDASTTAVYADSRGAEWNEVRMK